MIKRILNAIKNIIISAQQARAAAMLARSGKYEQAQALYKD